MESRQQTSHTSTPTKRSDWPLLPFHAWNDTRETLHRYFQIVGKIQLGSTARINHFWNVALNVTPRGLSTSAMPHEDRTFEIAFDLIGDELVIRTSDGGERRLPLMPRTVADFYEGVMTALHSLGIDVSIWDHPVELVSEAIPFHTDRTHRAYDREYVLRFFRLLERIVPVMDEFRSRFIGKASPVGFYWGTFDLAVARYSGRRAPNPPTNPIEREAYSHEMSEVGFWPGDDRFREPAFYALHAPSPEAYATGRVTPKGAFWRDDLHCFVLPYAAVRKAASPRDAILQFFESTYHLGASLARWDPDFERRSEGS